MVRWTGSNTGCPNHVNWPLNPNPSAVSSALRVGRREKEKEGREREKKRDGYSLLCFCVPFLSEPYATRNDGRAWCSSDLDRQTNPDVFLFVWDDHVPIPSYTPLLIAFSASRTNAPPSALLKTCVSYVTHASIVTHRRRPVGEALSLLPLLLSYFFHRCSTRKTP